MFLKLNKFKIKSATTSPKEKEQKPDPISKRYRPEQGGQKSFKLKAKVKTVKWLEKEETNGFGSAEREA